MKKRTKEGVRQNKGKPVGLIVVLAVVLLVVVILLAWQIRNWMLYTKAKDCYVAKEYAEALELYEQLGNYKDAEDQGDLCRINMAERYLNKKDLEHAKQWLADVPQGKEKEQAEYHCDYVEAEQCMEAGDYEGAYDLYTALAEHAYADAEKLEKDAEVKLAQQACENKIEELGFEVGETYDEYYDDEGYKLFNFDDDEIEELVVWEGECMPIDIYMYRNKSYEKIGTIDDRYLAYDRKSQILLGEDYSDTAVPFALFSIKDGKIKKIAEGSYGDYNGKDRICLDGKEIENLSWKEFLLKYGIEDEGAMEIVKDGYHGWGDG